MLSFKTYENKRTNETKSDILHQRYLIQKFNMTEVDAKYWYKHHFAHRCDDCDWIYNEHHDLDKHYKEVHQESHEVLIRIRDILKVANVHTITRKKVRAQLKKETVTEITLSNNEINVIIEEVMDEIEKKKSRREVENHEEDIIPDF